MTILLLKNILSDIRSQGKTIIALGAPVKGSTLINYCNLTTNEIDCGVEINPHKCGTYYPGTSIPVFHQDNVAAPDYFLLLSWNFKAEILSKRLKDEYNQRWAKCVLSESEKSSTIDEDYLDKAMKHYVNEKKDMALLQRYKMFCEIEKGRFMVALYGKEEVEKREKMEKEVQEYAQQMQQELMALDMDKAMEKMKELNT